MTPERMKQAGEIVAALDAQGIKCVMHGEFVKMEPMPPIDLVLDVREYRNEVATLLRQWDLAKGESK